jgi:hypothetical protein
MARFYLSILSDVFRELIKWRTITGLPVVLLIGILFWFNQAIGRWFVEKWEGISHIWALVSFGLCGIWIFLRVNYTRFHNLECENETLRNKQSEQ